MAAALAFYTILSIAPFLVLVIFFASLLVSPQDIQGQVADVANRLIGPQGAEQLKALLGAGAVQGTGTLARLISALVLAVGSTGGVLQLQASLNRIWSNGPPKAGAGISGFFLKRVISFLMIPAVAAVLLISLVMTTVLRAVTDQLPSFLGTAAVQRGLGELATLTTVAILFAALFKYLPDARVSWGQAWRGAVVTGILFTAAKFGIGTYLGRQHLGSTFGAGSSIVLLLLWIYYSGLVFFFGAEITRARSPDRAG